MTQNNKNSPTLADLTRAAGQVATPTKLPSDAQQPVGAASDADKDVATNVPQSWTEFDESAFRSLQQRRKLAGHKARGADVAGQLLRVGPIKPNANTVASAIVGLLPATGSITRSELLARMAATDFTSKSAKPDDRNWCQGYVAGVIRSGFVDVMSETSVKITATAEAA